MCCGCSVMCMLLLCSWVRDVRYFVEVGFCLLMVSSRQSLIWCCCNCLVEVRICLQILVLFRLLVCRGMKFLLSSLRLVLCWCMYRRCVSRCLIVVLVSSGGVLERKVDRLMCWCCLCRESLLLINVLFFVQMLWVKSLNLLFVLWLLRQSYFNGGGVLFVVVISDGFMGKFC